LHDYLSNGNDGYALVKGTESDFVIIDKIGTWDADPADGWDVADVTNATEDHTLVRKDSVLTGETDWSISAGTNSASSGWLIFNVDSVEFLGWHINKPANEAEIISFVLADELETAMISAENAQVTSTVLWGTDVTALAPEITISSGAQVTPTTGTVKDFTEAVKYIVTAEDGTEKEWKVTVIVADEPAVVTIKDIQFTEDESGDSPLFDDLVKTQGIITGFDAYGFYIQDKAEAWSGIYVFAPDDIANYSVADEVTVTGTVNEYYGLTQLYEIISIELVDSDNDIPAAITATVPEVAEANESIIVTVSDLVCTDTELYYDAWQATSGSDALYIGTELFVSSPAIDDAFETITGIATYKRDFFRVMPRSADDLVVAISISEDNLSAISMYPNPVNNQLLIENLEGINQVIISNVLGQKVIAKDVTDSKITINTSEFKSGVFIVTIVSETGASRSQRIIKE
jgi:hypothetical protein